MDTTATKRYLSADGHVVRPADLWTIRMDKRFRDWASHGDPRPEGDHDIIDGLEPLPLGWPWKRSWRAKLWPLMGVTLRPGQASMIHRLR